MFERKDLLHLVFWPRHQDSEEFISLVELVSPEGEVVGDFRLNEPKTGLELSKLLPQEFSLVSRNCAVAGLAGGLVTITETPFDSAVVTEKREETFEDRFAKLEGRVRRSEQREAKLAKENAQLLAERAKAASEAAQAERDAQAALDEVSPPDDAQQPPVTPEGGAGDE